jgi:hypothetical protein
MLTLNKNDKTIWLLGTMGIKAEHDKAGRLICCGREKIERLFGV